MLISQLFHLHLYPGLTPHGHLFSLFAILLRVTCQSTSDLAIFKFSVSFHSLFNKHAVYVEQPFILIIKAAPFFH